MNSKLATVSLATIAALFLTGTFAWVFADDRTEDEVQAKIFKKYEDRTAECLGQETKQCGNVIEKCNEFIVKNEQQGNLGC
jgi:hypothetical protein